MAGITGDILWRQYMGMSNRADVLNGFVPLGGIQTLAVIQGVATGGASITLLSSQISSVCLFDSASGGVFNLPAPATIPIGSWFEFVTTATITSNSAKILTDSATTFLVGGIASINATASALYAANGTTSRSVNGNGTTTGGIAGSRYRVTLINTTQWFLEGTTYSSGTVATCIATS